MNDEVPDDARFLRLSDAITGAFGADGSTDHDGYEAALAEASQAGIGRQLMLAWAAVLASTHAGDERPLDLYVDRLAEEIEDAICEAVRHHGHALIDTARRGDDAALGECWFAVVTGLDDEGLSWLAWALAAALAPVMRMLGGLERFAVAAELASDAARHTGTTGATRGHCRSIGAALCAAATGAAVAHAHVAAKQCLSLVPIDHTLKILIGLIPQLLPDGRTTVYHLDQDGVPDGVADPDGADARRLTAVVTAAIAGDGRGVASAVGNATPEEIIDLTWNVLISLGTAFSRMGTTGHPDSH